ncbi:MAG: rod shape-determining protein MreD [Anaerolineae bacterium]
MEVSISPYLAIPIMAFIGLLQSALVSRIRIFGVSPDLVLLVTVSWVLLQGHRRALLPALVGGLMIDALSGARFGLATLSLVVVVALASLGETNVFRTARYLPILTIALASLVYNLLYLLLLKMTGYPTQISAMLWRVVLPIVLIDTLFMPLVYTPARWVAKRVGPRAVEWQ